MVTPANTLNLQLKKFGKAAIFYVPIFLIKNEYLTIGKRYKITITEVENG